MTPSQLTTLHHAEDTATAAQVRLERLENLKRGTIEAMLGAANAVLRSLDPESLKLIDWDALSYRVTKGVGKAMDQVMINAEDHANDAANFVHDLECEAADAAHVERSMPAHTALAAE